MAEHDSGSGQHDLASDGTTPGSPLLVDHNLAAKTIAEYYTPGVGESNAQTWAEDFYGFDAVGSNRALVNTGQGLAATSSYYAYGILRAHTGLSSEFGLWVADDYQTDPNGLMLLGNRVYHPFTGRFLTRDPAGAGDNDYEYANNNPLSFVDPSGLDPTMSSFNVPAGTSNQAIIDQAIQNGAAPGTSLNVSDANGKFLYSVEVPSSNGFSMFRLPNDPSGLPGGWEKLPHGQNGISGPGGQTRWKGPNGQDGLEHHPPKEGNHGGKPNWHPLKRVTNSQGKEKWGFTNPKETLYPGDEFNPFSGYSLPEPDMNLEVVGGVTVGGLFILGGIVLLSPVGL